MGRSITLKPFYLKSVFGETQEYNKVCNIIGKESLLFSSHFSTKSFYTFPRHRVLVLLQITSVVAGSTKSLEKNSYSQTNKTAIVGGDMIE